VVVGGGGVLIVVLELLSDEIREEVESEMETLNSFNQELNYFD